MDGEKSESGAFSPDSHKAGSHKSQINANFIAQAAHESRLQVGLGIR